MNLAPDAYRYLAAAQGRPVPKPFHLRWMLPWALGTNLRAWWVVYVVSFPVAGAALFAWRVNEGDGWRFALAAAVVFLALPGLSGPAVRPIGIDMPAAALSLIGVWCLSMDGTGQQLAGVLVLAWAATIKETSPLWAALWAWNPLALIALVPVLVRACMAHTGPDPTGMASLQYIADHPFRSAIQSRAGRWRDGWLYVAPWGLCLAAFIEPTPQVLLVVALAYLQLLVATDTVRLVHHAAGPVLAVAAVGHVPVGWLLLAVVLHSFWFRRNMEVV